MSRLRERRHGCGTSRGNKIVVVVNQMQDDDKQDIIKRLSLARSNSRKTPRQKRSAIPSQTASENIPPGHFEESALTRNEITSSIRMWREKMVDASTEKTQTTQMARLPRRLQPDLKWSASQKATSAGYPSTASNSRPQIPPRKGRKSNPAGIR